MVLKSVLSLLTFGLGVSAHFDLLYPRARGNNEDKLSTFPCGGFSDVGSNRTLVPLSDIAIAIEQGHDQSYVQVLLAIGNDPGSNFNITLKPTFYQTGEGPFCLPSIAIPSSLNIADGTNATIQIVTSGDGSGGLYNCADVTFSSTAPVLVQSSCTNGTGITASNLPASQSTINANSTQPASTSASASASATAQGAATALTAGWGVLGAAALGAIALL